MPPKKDAKKGAKETAGDFETVTYTSNQLKTATTLLTVEDDAVIIKSLDHLNKYAREFCDYKMNLIREEIVQKLQKVAERSNEVIIKLSLKLIADLLRDNKIKEAALPDFKKPFIDRLSNLISGNADEVIKELSLYILLVLLSSEYLRTQVCAVGFVVKLFFVLENEKDPDVQRNTLDILCNLMNPRLEVFEVLPPADIKYPKLLLCYLLHDFKEMQLLAMQLLEQLTQYECCQFHQLMVDAKVVEKMLEMLQDPILEYQHERARNITLNLIEYESLSHTFIKSEEFKLYLKFIVSCAEKYLAAASEIMRKVCSFINFHQPLYDFSADQAVLSMFRANDFDIQANLCIMVKDLIAYDGFCENLLTEDSLDHIIAMLSHEDTITNAFVAIHCFLKNNKRTLSMLYKLRGFDKIFSIFLFDKNQEQEYTPIVADIVHMYCSIAAYSEEILTEEFCRIMLKRFKEYPIEMLKLMNCFAHDEEFLRMFVENDGAKTTINSIKTTNDEQILRQIIIFIHTVVADLDVCKRFLKDRLYTCLATISKDTRGRIPLISHLENKLYDMYLPLKFHLKGRLEISDKLDSGFYLIDGYKSGEFPFLTTLLGEHITTDYTVYTVDYSYTPNLKNISKESLMRSTSQIKTSGIAIGSSAKMLQGSACDLERRGSLSQLMVDRFLPVFILKAFKTIYARVNANLDPKDRASMLAVFVEQKTSGNAEIETPEQHAHYYGYHIATLKKKMASNLIPIGHIRSGKHCERALLFKAIADRIGIPCTLVRGRRGLYWNEIPLPITMEKYMAAKTRKNYLAYGIVDLMENVGSVLTVGSASAKRYCQVEPEQ